MADETRRRRGIDDGFYLDAPAIHDDFGIPAPAIHDEIGVHVMADEPMTDEPMTDEQLAEIYKQWQEAHTSLTMGTFDKPRPDVAARHRTIDYAAHVGALLEEVERLRAREAALRVIAQRLIELEAEELGDDRYHGGFGYAVESVDAIAIDARALLAQE